jgi:hypothetical protein
MASLFFLANSSITTDREPNLLSSILFEDRFSWPIHQLRQIENLTFSPRS